MVKFRGRVLFKDGHVEAFETGSAAMTAWELYAMRNRLPMGTEMPPILGSLCIAHHALGVEEGFDTWRAGVDGVEMESEEVPPTLSVATNG